MHSYVLIQLEMSQCGLSEQADNGCKKYEDMPHELPPSDVN
ncbi:hypothetical protein RUM4293_02635 [Ruegeria atlantica]|uniref:Uncharacterized protein n=1 Tax=Ruegeria atlantica TaxID=81569 RepID=A0A0N7LNY8_9RHOB|nr:hypothetical protein RUM4293_02635 [Ruegeria atlantica]